MLYILVRHYTTIIIIIIRMGLINGTIEWCLEDLKFCLVIVGT